MLIPNQTYIMLWKQNKPLFIGRNPQPWVQQVALIASHFLFVDKPIPGNTLFARICSKLGWMQARLITDGLNFHVAATFLWSEEAFQRAPHKREGCYGDGGHSKNKTLLISLICNCSHAVARAFFNVRRVGSVFSTFIIIQLHIICPLIYMDPPPV